MNIEKPRGVREILDNIKEIGFYDITHRVEWRHFFSNNLIAHNVLVLVKGSDEVWIKIKKDKKLLFTPIITFQFSLDMKLK